MPLRAVEYRDDLLARGRHLALDLDFFRVEVEQAAVEADASDTHEALVDPRAAQYVACWIADNRHRGQAEHPARHEHVDSGRLGKCDRIEETVGHDDDLALLAQFQRQVVRGRAGVECDRLPVSDHRRRGSGDCSLLGRLKMKPDVEGELRLSALEPAHSSADAGHQSLARELGEVVSHRDLGHRKLIRKFRNVNTVLGLEEGKDVLHPLGACRRRQKRGEPTKLVSNLSIGLSKLDKSKALSRPRPPGRQVSRAMDALDARQLDVRGCRRPRKKVTGASLANSRHSPIGYQSALRE